MNGVIFEKGCSSGIRYSSITPLRGALKLVVIMECVGNGCTVDNFKSRLFLYFRLGAKNHSEI